MQYARAETSNYEPLVKILTVPFNFLTPVSFQGDLKTFSVDFSGPFVKRFALSYRTVVCPVCDVRVLWPNGWIDQDETWHAGRPWLQPHCVRWDPAPPLTELPILQRGTAPNFRPMFVVAKWLDGSRCHLVGR